MRFPCRLWGIVAAVALLQGAVVAGPVIVVPAASYNVSVGTGFCAGFNCDTPYNSSAIAHAPATFQVGCSADAGAPACAGGILDAGAGPFLSVAASTTLNHTQQNSNADANVTYYYEVVCNSCPVGTIVPMSIAGSMEAHFIQGTVPPNGTVTFGDLDRAFVNGYNPVTSKDNVLIDFALEGLGASATDLTKTPNPLTATPPNGFGFCESTWTGFYTCNSGPSSPFGTPFEAVVNEQYSIFLDAQVSVQAANQPFATDSAEATIDPVLSFGPGFDSTGYSIVLSPGIGNQASPVPEPATWMLFSIAAVAWVSGQRLRSWIRGSSRVFLLSDVRSAQRNGQVLPEVHVG